MFVYWNCVAERLCTRGKTKKSSPSKLVYPRCFFGGRQANADINYAYDQAIPKMAAQHALVVVYSVEILDYVFMTKPKGKLLKYQMYAVIFALGLGHVLTQ